MNQKRFQKQTDKGWQSMSELLEREMPATKRRRPAAVAWWSLALWVLTVLGLIAWWWNQKANQEQVLAPARQVQEEIKKQAPTTSYNAQPDPSTQQRRAAAPTSAAYVRNAQPQPRGQREHPSSWLADEGKTARAQAHNTLADAQLPAQQPLAENPENQAALAAAPEEDFSAGWRGQQLPPLPYHLLENEGALDLPASGGLPFPTKARVKSARNKRYSPWRVGASLTASTEHFNAANSASLGGVLDWQPKRSHWGLRSGLAYEHYRPSGFARPIAEVNADRYADATRNYAFLFNNGVYVPGTSEALGLDVALPVVLMQRLRVPLLVYWQPARWLRCYGGGSFSYTLRAHTLREGLAFDEELVGARSASSAARVNKLATQELPRFNAQIQSGLGLRLGKRWEIEMNYRQSAKIQFKSLFEKRVEEGQPVSHVPTFRRPNHHFVSVSGIYFFGK